MIPKAGKHIWTKYTKIQSAYRLMKHQKLNVMILDEQAATNRFLDFTQAATSYAEKWSKKSANDAVFLMATWRWL